MESQAHVQVVWFRDLRSGMVSRCGLLHHRQHGQHCKDIQRSDRYSNKSASTVIDIQCN